MAFTIKSRRLEQLNTVLPLIVKKELPVPVIFSNEEQGFDLVWDTPKGRVTLFIGEAYEIEIVPVSDLKPVQTEDAEEAVEHVKEHYSQKFFVDTMIEFIEELEKNREEIYRKRLEKNAQKKS